jgi:hypothetical protein
VLLSIGLKFLAGIGFSLVTLPIFVSVFFCGQWIGGKIQTRSA